MGRAVQPDVHAALTAHPALQYENWSPMSTNAQLLGVHRFPSPSWELRTKRFALGHFARCRACYHLATLACFPASQHTRRYGDDEMNPTAQLSFTAQRRRTPPVRLSRGEPLKASELFG